MITLQADEKVLMEVRKHWLMIVIHAVILFALALIPLLVLPLILFYIFPTVVASIYFFVSATWLLFVWVMFFVMWTNYYLDVFVITNKRFIDMEQIVLFTHDEVTVPMENIEDIKIEVKGILANILKFGDLQIQTAGATKETIAKHIMRPEQVLACLQGAVEQQRGTA